MSTPAVKASVANVCLATWNENFFYSGICGPIAKYAFIPNTQLGKYAVFRRSIPLFRHPFPGIHVQWQIQQCAGFILAYLYLPPIPVLLICFQHKFLMSMMRKPQKQENKNAAFISSRRQGVAIRRFTSSTVRYSRLASESESISRLISWMGLTGAGSP